MIRGFDTNHEVGYLASMIAETGYAFVGRYLKNLTPGEVRALSAAGVGIVSIWERRGDRATFTSNQGQADGVAARTAARALGQPKGSVIVSAIDYDAPEADWLNIQSYFFSFHAALGEYEAGAYGNGLMLGKLLDAGLISVAYKAGAADWAGSTGFVRWHIKQQPTVFDVTLGISIDPCDAIDGFIGAWRLPSSAAPEVPTALSLQQALNAHGANLSEDGVWGPRSAAALAAHYRR